MFIVVAFCAVIQRLAELKTIVKTHSGDAARNVTTATVIRAISLLEPSHANTAERFCWLLADITAVGNAGINAVMESGAIPVVLQLMQRWKAEGTVVWRACASLLNICLRGTAADKEAIIAHDPEQLLKEAVAEGKGVHPQSGRDLASEVLEDLFVSEVRLTLLIMSCCVCSIFSQLSVS